MPSTLTELIAEWPHDLQAHMSRSHRGKVELGIWIYQFDPACYRCALERWRDEWAAQLGTSDLDGDEAWFRKNVLGVEDKP